MDTQLARRLAADPQLARFQELYLGGVIDGIALVAADADACHACLGLTDRSYLPSGLPALPVTNCERGTGCRCRYEPNFVVYE